MKYLFGVTSKIFIPPYDQFNNNTLKAMSHLGIHIISSMEYQEDTFDHKRTLFVANGETHNNIGNQTIYHLPGTISKRQLVSRIAQKILKSLFFLLSFE